MGKGGKTKGGDSLPVRQALPATTVPLVPLPAFDAAAVAKETWALKKGVLFEEPLLPLPADIASRVVSWLRPAEVLQAAADRRKAELQAAGDAAGAALVKPAAPRSAAPLMLEGQPVRAIATGFASAAAAAAAAAGAEEGDGSGGGGGGSAAAAAVLPSVAALESAMWALHSLEDIVPEGSFLWESIAPQGQGKEAGTGVCVFLISSPPAPEIKEFLIVWRE